MTKDEKREKKREKDRRHYARHKAQLKARFRAWYLANREKVLTRVKIRTVRVMGDPDLYARRLETLRRFRERHGARLNAEKAAWRKAHKHRDRMARRWERDRRKARFAQCPELYAAFRARCRKWWANVGRKKCLRTRPYRPRPTCRIPDCCAWQKVVDRRSVFLWNNRPAASLVAGRHYQLEKRVGACCDRFGKM